jgi:AcrR family transcriptional regulator
VSQPRLSPPIGNDLAVADQDEPTPPRPPDRSRRRGTGGNDAKSAAREPIVDAAIATILELGFYRASSNEIARRANVSWGSIQYHFGTREGLLLAVVEELNQRFITMVRRASITGDSLEERLQSLYLTLGPYYGAPRYLARLQIVLNLSHDPGTSAEVHDALARLAEAAGQEMRRLLNDAVGREASMTTKNAVFHAIRGTALSYQVTDALSDHDPSPDTRTINDDEIAVLLTGLAKAALLDPGTNA